MEVSGEGELGTRYQELTVGDTFWKRLEDVKGIQIPIYMKNILKLNNLDNPIAFQCISEETLAELEEFARESMRDFLKRSDNTEAYYGRYAKMPQKFRFLIGDRFMLLSLVSFVKSKPEDYWRCHVAAAAVTPPQPVIMPASPFSHVYVKSNLVPEEEEQEEEEEEDRDGDGGGDGRGGEGEREEVDPIQDEPQDEQPGNNQPELRQQIRVQVQSTPTKPLSPVEAQLRASEIKELARIVKHALWRDLHNHQDFRKLLKNIGIKVGVEKISKNTEPASFLISGSIRCVMCSSVSHIRKVWKPRVNQPRWVISNYRRHIKNHFKEKKRPEY